MFGPPKPSNFRAVHPTCGQTWCCHHFQRGCAATTLSTTLPYDCHLVGFCQSFDSFRSTHRWWNLIAILEGSKVLQFITAILSDVPSWYCWGWSTRYIINPWQKAINGQYIHPSQGRKNSWWPRRTEMDWHLRRSKGLLLKVQITSSRFLDEGLRTKKP